LFFGFAEKQMPVHVAKMDSEVTVIDGELPLTEAQVEKLVQIVIKKLEGVQRESQKSSEATTLRRSATPPGVCE
jgi:hypothetical protein